jgi:hypothetical protein
MKVYVSAKFNDKERVQSVYALLKQAGHTITHEWIHNKPSYPFSDDPAFTAQCAAEDIEGVRRADVFILLSNAEPSMGASAELGAAIALFLNFKKPYIYVIGPHFDSNFCFYHPAVVRKDSVEDVLAEMNSVPFLEDQSVLELKSHAK